MTRRNLGWFVTAAILALLVSVSTPAFPQAPGTSAPAGEAKGKDAPPAAPDAAHREGNQTVDNILREQEQLLSGQRFSYDPGGRRDPFRSLFESVPLSKKGPRPRGVAGMLVNEVALVGIVRDSAGGNIAFFTGSDGKGYFLRVGDEVYDGTLISIDPATGTATFRQEVDDPRLIKPYRDVPKKLVVQGEEKGNE
jgi:hypothetical protein